MPRRTKEEALATRQRLLDAAEVIFHAQGVSRTTLQDIAEQAGATRGAIYWHFKDKAALFNAMMERVALPMESAGPGGEFDNRHPLETLERGLVRALEIMTADAHVRRVFEIAVHKVEYTDEMRSVLERHLTARNGACIKFERALLIAARHQDIEPAMPAKAAAQALHALIIGLIQDWLLDSRAFELVPMGQNAYRTFLHGLGYTFPAAPRDIRGVSEAARPL